MYLLNSSERFDELKRKSTGTDKFANRKQFESESNYYDKLMSKTQTQIANGRNPRSRNEDSPNAASFLSNNR